MDKKMPSEEKKFLEGYPSDVEERPLPKMKSYDFLYERNKPFMNYTALSFADKKITYEEMHTRIDEYARALYKRGVRAGDKIAVCLVNTPESIYLLYALNKLGATVVGLSPMNNEYKMKRDIEMVRPKMVISVDMMYGKFKDAESTLQFTPILYSPVESIGNPLVKTLYGGKQILAGNVVWNPNQRLASIVSRGKRYTDVSFPKYEPGTTDIMFTGGSTGVHKGVELDENGINCVVQSLDQILTLEPGMVHLGNIPFGHMAFGRLVMHYALCNNLEYALTLDMLPNKFADELIRTKADGAMGGPVHWNALINNPKITPGSLANLKQAISGGELYIPDQRKAANAMLKQGGSFAEIGDGLGLTETWAPICVCMAGKNTPDTVGYPLPYCNVKVVDPNTMEEVERNVPGLLLVTGPGLMNQYYNNPQETAQVFVEDSDGTKWYNTGDIVVRLNSDEIKFAGRKKRNFVCGVDNIYPEQIEVLLSNLPEICEIAVTKIPDETHQNLPKYHIRLNDPYSDISEVESRMSAIICSTLGESALPGYIEYHETPLPRTDNGKLDAATLERQDKEQMARGNICKTGRTLIK